MIVPDWIYYPWVLFTGMMVTHFAHKAWDWWKRLDVEDKIDYEAL